MRSSRALVPLLTCLVAGLFVTGLASAETNYIRCGTKMPDAAELARQPRGDCSLVNTTPAEEYEPDEVIVVSVVFHLLMDDAGTGEISDQLCESQIDILNEDFRAMPGTPGFAGYDSKIQFQLATEDPQGEPTTGITRTTNTFWFNDQQDPLLGWYYDNLNWDAHRYLNLYSMHPVAPGGIILGYVNHFPAESNGAWVGTTQDYVSLLWNSIGRNSGNPPYDQGRTATHEVGHWFGLYHVFQGGCGGSDCYRTGDLICDTEPDSESHGGCPNSFSCNTPDPVHNYMEYTNDTCMNQFTHEQARRMQCTITHYRPNLPKEIVAVSDPSLGRFALHQNRPNPFNPTTEISFEVSRRGYVSLTILDAGGRVVRSLLSSPRDAGRHDVSWDGTNDAGEIAGSGVYFYRLTTTDARETRRMVLLK